MSLKKTEKLNRKSRVRSEAHYGQDASINFSNSVVFLTFKQLNFKNPNSELEFKSDAILELNALF